MNFDILNKGWFGSMLGLFGIVLAIYFYIKGRSVKRLAYQARTVHLIGGEKAELPLAVKVTFNDLNVPLLAKSTIIIWNDGNTIFNGTDLTPNDPLRIELPQDTNILEAKISKLTRSVIAFQLLKNPEKENYINCNFDFLDKSDGVKIEILHTSANEEFFLKGTIKELPNGVTYMGRIPSNVKIKNIKNKSLNSKLLFFVFSKREFFYGIMVAIGVSVFMMGLFSPSIVAYFPQLGGTSDPMFSTEKSSKHLMVMGAIYSILPLVNWWMDRKKFPNILSE